MKDDQGLVDYRRYTSIDRLWKDYGSVRKKTCRIGSAIGRFVVSHMLLRTLAIIVAPVR